MGINLGISLTGAILSFISLVTAHSRINKLKNNAKIDNSNDSNINQYQDSNVTNNNVTNNNGMDKKETMECSIKAAQMEFERYSEKIEEKINIYKEELLKIEQRVNKMPTIHRSPNPPQGGANGDIWHQYT